MRQIIEIFIFTKRYSKFGVILILGDILNYFRLRAPWNKLTVVLCLTYDFIDCIKICFEQPCF